MPPLGVLLAAAAVAGVLSVGDAVVHLKPVHKFNHVVCRVATVGQKLRLIAVHLYDRSQKLWGYLGWGLALWELGWFLAQKALQ